MWVIIVNKNLSTHRDVVISGLLDGVKSPENYLSKPSGYKYNSTSYLGGSLVYKTKSGADRVIKRFNSNSNKDSYSSKYSWIKDSHLSSRKLSREEWYIIVNDEIHRLESKYKISRSKLESKLSQYK